MNGDQAYFGDWGASNDDYFHLPGGGDGHVVSGGNGMKGSNGPTNDEGCNRTAAGHQHRITYRNQGNNGGHGDHGVESSVSNNNNHSHSVSVEVSDVTLPDTGSANLPRCKTIFYYICAEI